MKQIKWLNQRLNKGISNFRNVCDRLRTNVYNGVLQDCCQVLFSLYIHDLPQQCSDVDLKMNADNTAAHTNPGTAETLKLTLGLHDI